MKQLLLVGGGHSHLAVLKSFGDAPAEGVRLALLSPSRHALYSGMVPGVVAGHYPPGECRIDLVALAQRAGARFLMDSAAGVDPARREVTTAGGERLRYDVLSLDTGSSAGEPSAAAEHALRVRPVEPFLAGWERLRESVRKGEVRRIAVIGGGAAGVEVLLAMRHGLAGSAAQFALFSELPVLAGHGARRRIARILGERGVTVAERSLPRTKTESSSTAANASRRRPRYAQPERTPPPGSSRAGLPPMRAASSP